MSCGQTLYLICKMHKPSLMAQDHGLAITEHRAVASQHGACTRNLQGKACIANRRISSRIHRICRTARCNLRHRMWFQASNSHRLVCRTTSQCNLDLQYGATSRCSPCLRVHFLRATRRCPATLQVALACLLSNRCRTINLHRCRVNKASRPFRGRTCNQIKTCHRGQTWRRVRTCPDQTPQTCSRTKLRNRDRTCRLARTCHLGLVQICGLLSKYHLRTDQTCRKFRTCHQDKICRLVMDRMHQYRVGFLGLAQELRGQFRRDREVDRYSENRERTRRKDMGRA